MLVERVLEPRREWISAVSIAGKRWNSSSGSVGAVLDGASQTVCAGDVAELAEDVEVELDLRHAAAGSGTPPWLVPVWTLTFEMPAAPGSRASSSRR